MSHTQYPPARQRLQRSELAVPGSNPGMFEKAAASPADYVFLDLEDAVSPGDKVQARKNISKVRLGILVITTIILLMKSLLLDFRKKCFHKS